MSLKIRSEIDVSHLCVGRSRPFDFDENWQVCCDHCLNEFSQFWISSAGEFSFYYDQSFPQTLAWPKQNCLALARCQVMPMTTAYIREVPVALLQRFLCFFFVLEFVYQWPTGQLLLCFTQSWAFSTCL